MKEEVKVMLNKDLSISQRKDLQEVKECQKAKLKMITVIIINIINVEIVNQSYQLLLNHGLNQKE